MSPTNGDELMFLVLICSDEHRPQTSADSEYLWSRLAVGENQRAKYQNVLICEPSTYADPSKKVVPHKVRAVVLCTFFAYSK